MSAPTKMENGTSTAKNSNLMDLACSVLHGISTLISDVITASELFSLQRKHSLTLTQHWEVTCQ